MAFSDSKKYTDVASYNEADGVNFSDGVFSVPAGKQLEATLRIVPDFGYDKVGSGAIVFKAVDASGNTANSTVNYSVVFKNRAPEYVGPADFSVGKGEQTSTITYASLFSDPDGDEFTCTAVSANTNTAAVFTSDEGFIISGKKTGRTGVTVTATDANGAMVSQTVTVYVTRATGIDDVTTDKGDFTVSTDADNGTIGVTVNDHVGKAVISLYDAAGKLLAKKTVKNLHAGDSVSVASPNVPGAYTLNIVLDDKASTVKFTK